MRFLNPHYFRKITKIIIPCSISLMLVFFALGIYYSFFNSPEDYQQGMLIRIMYVHVPCAWISTLIYTSMTCFSIMYLVKKIQILYLINVASTYVGLVFTFLTLITGSLWGKPTWGTWWVWDSRLTSVFVMFLFYLSNIIIIQANANIIRSATPSSIFVILGFINIPIVKFSVNIWNSLHQKSSILKIGGPSIDGSMLIPLIIMGLGFLFATISLIFIKTNNILLKLKLEHII